MARQHSTRGRSHKHSRPNVAHTPPAPRLEPAQRGTWENPVDNLAEKFKDFKIRRRSLIPIYANTILEVKPDTPLRVFVHHEGVHEPEDVSLDSDTSFTAEASYSRALWKAEIREVRQCPRNKFYFQVAWYYHLEDIPAEPGSSSNYRAAIAGAFSPFDLILTSHVTVIKASSVVYIEVQAALQMRGRTLLAADDKDCYCGAPYNPWTQRQAYCQSCKRWMHIIPQCAKRVANMDLSHLGHGKSIVDHILDATIVRGYGIASEEDCDADDIPEDEHWWVVGWHRLHQFCSQNSVLPKDWQEKKLGDGLAVSSGWPRNEPEKRAQFAKTLMQHIKKRPVKVGFESIFVRLSQLPLNTPQFKVRRNVTDMKPEGLGTGRREIDGGRGIEI
ncbi:hypothetical protein C8R43DRAFT_952787 [Mycena crocata]|nr:hypothetical protein C8R43DRAFT_952787 [Mycena crocata]